MSSMDARFIDATEMLPIPKGARPAAAKRSGRACVWCGATARLLAGLGPRLAVIKGELTRWYPQGCAVCVREQAARVYALHVRVCQRCAPRQYCHDARALYELSQSLPSHASPVSRLEPIREG